MIEFNLITTANSQSTRLDLDPNSDRDSRSRQQA